MFRQLRTASLPVYDVPVFDRFARLYDLVMPPTDPTPLLDGFARAEGRVETIVDVGGGSGRVARALDNSPIVLDASRGMLERASRANLAVVKADAGRLPIADGAVDAVTIVDALHHFPDPQLALREARRVIRPGGVVVIREFDPSTILGRFLEIGEFAIGFNSTFFEPTTLVSAAENVGLEAIVLDRGFAYTMVAMQEFDGETNRE